METCIASGLFTLVLAPSLVPGMDILLKDNVKYYKEWKKMHMLRISCLDGLLFQDEKFLCCQALGPMCKTRYPPRTRADSRVVPAWVAQDTNILDSLHSVGDRIQ